MYFVGPSSFALISVRLHWSGCVLAVCDSWVLQQVKVSCSRISLGVLPCTSLPDAVRLKSCLVRMSRDAHVSSLYTLYLWFKNLLTSQWQRAAFFVED